MVSFWVYMGEYFGLDHHPELLAGGDEFLESYFVVKVPDMDKGGTLPDALFLKRRTPLVHLVIYH